MFGTVKAFETRLFPSSLGTHSAQRSVFGQKLPISRIVNRYLVLGDGGNRRVLTEEGCRRLGLPRGKVGATVEQPSDRSPGNRGSFTRAGKLSSILRAIHLTQPIQHLVAAPAFRRSSGRSGGRAVPTGRRACLAKPTFAG